MSAPLRIRCEGSGAPGTPPGGQLCAVCGQLWPTTEDGGMVPHDRDDAARRVRCPGSGVPGYARGAEWALCSECGALGPEPDGRMIVHDRDAP